MSVYKYITCIRVRTYIHMYVHARMYVFVCV